MKSLGIALLLLFVSSASQAKVWFNALHDTKYMSKVQLCRVDVSHRMDSFVPLPISLYDVYCSLPNGVLYSDNVYHEATYEREGTFDQRVSELLKSLRELGLNNEHPFDNPNVNPDDSSQQTFFIARNVVITDMAAEKASSEKHNQERLQTEIAAREKKQMEHLDFQKNFYECIIHRINVVGGSDKFVLFKRPKDSTGLNEAKPLSNSVFPTHDRDSLAAQCKQAEAESECTCDKLNFDF
jgi:hypothetical protein